MCVSYRASYALGRKRSQRHRICIGCAYNDLNHRDVEYPLGLPTMSEAEMHQQLFEFSVCEGCLHFQIHLSLMSFIANTIKATRVGSISLEKQVRVSLFILGRSTASFT